MKGLKKDFSLFLIIVVMFSYCYTRVLAGENERLNLRSNIATVVEFEDADVEDGKVHYTIAGGVNDWNPKNVANEMQPTAWDGVYAISINLLAYDEAAEWNSRFKICRIDDITVAGEGWMGSLCLGTNVYDDSQTMFRVENEETIKNAVVYHDTNTGAVVILKDGEPIDYKFSWVGYEAEAGYTDIANFNTCGITWPAEKVKVESIPDIKAGYDALLAKVTGVDLEDESLYENGNVKYTVAGGSTPFPWGPTASCNEMKESEIRGVYTFKMTVPAYDEATEWNNRFKICRLDDVICVNGWLGSLCLGTDIYDDNQTTFRIECPEETEITIYFQPSTGAVVMYDAAGNEVDYKFSWVGYDNEVQYTTVSEFATCGYTWPDDKLKTDEVPDIAAKYNRLSGIITENNPDIHTDGDINHDGKVDIKDSALLKRHLAGWESEIDKQKADLDGDGEVTIKDSVLIRRRLAGWQ